MNRASLARRFAPLMAVVVVQLLIIALAPSRAPEQVAAASGGARLRRPAHRRDRRRGRDGGRRRHARSGAGGRRRRRTAGRRWTPGRPAAPRARAAGGVRRRATPVTARATASSTPEIYPWAPPCQGKFAGNNGGDTYAGITKGVIKVVVMRGNYGAAVDAALTAAGSNPAPAAFDAALRTAEKFINTNYELYGRKVVFKQRKFSCGTGGEGRPDDQCLRNGGPPHRHGGEAVRHHLEQLGVVGDLRRVQQPQGPQHRWLRLP